MSAIDIFNTMPRIAQEAVRNRFLSDLRNEFDTTDVQAEFLADPNINAQYEAFLDHAWHDYKAASDETWEQWLEKQFAT